MSIQLAHEVSVLKKRVEELEQRLQRESADELAQVIERIAKLERFHRPGRKPKAD